MSESVFFLTLAAFAFACVVLVSTLTRRGSREAPKGGAGEKSRRELLVAGVSTLLGVTVLPRRASAEGWINGLRMIASGTTSVPGAGVTTLATVTMLPNENPFVRAFVTDNVAGAVWSEGSAPLPVVDRITLFYERTTNANEVLLRADNSNVATARNVRWCLCGIQG